MAQYRQSGAERFPGRGNDSHWTNRDVDQIGAGGIRAPHRQGRMRRFGRSDKHPKALLTVLLLILVLVLVITVFAYSHISGDKDHEHFLEDEDKIARTNFLSQATQTSGFKVLKFGQGSVLHGRDSRYWDRDDRRRDNEYDEDASEHSYKDVQQRFTDDSNVVEPGKNGSKKSLSSDTHIQSSELKTIGLYNEAGRDELKHYEAEYEDSIKTTRLTEQGTSNEHSNSSVSMGLLSNERDSLDEYDDGIDSQDAHVEESNDRMRGNSDNFHMRKVYRGQNSESLANKSEADTTVLSERTHHVREESVGINGGRPMKVASTLEKKSDTRRQGKHKKFSSFPCEIKFLNSTAQVVEPVESKKFVRFSLQYTEKEDKPVDDDWTPRFAGHQSLTEREESFYARDQKIMCGFVKSPNGYPSTGFDLAEVDMRYMRSCHIAVSSCIFGNSDNLRSPTNKVVTRFSRNNVCFVMFMDETTLQMLSSEGQSPDKAGFIGLWKIVIVKNLPYDDMRRVGKIPKFLTHRLFPSARYSIWLDSKLRLQSDPMLILEYFLWRKNYEYAISNHYDRHCVWEEVMQNKKLNKFNHTIIDQQFEFYQADGLKKFDASDPSRPLPSYVPEGSFILRAHTPMSNLFSCLWFNEVDRFTPRDQLSFAYTYLKLTRMNPGKPFFLNMFKDCERRSIAKLFHHKPEDKRNNAVQ